MKTWSYWLAGIYATILISVSGAPVIAQTQSEPASPAPSPGIEQVVVTAEKRAENVQNVPISITAIQGQDLKAMNVTGTIELSQMVSGLDITTSPANVLLPFIRGVGNDSNDAGNESSNAVYVDDVYVPRLDGALYELTDIDRVEVLRGPQGTLFGRNSTGGLVNIVTRTPTQDLDIDASAGFGNYDTVLDKVYVGGGVTDHLVGSFAGLYTDQMQGWGTNTTTGRGIGQDRAIAARTKWIYDVDGKTQIRLIASYDRDTSDQGPQQQLFPGTIAGTEPGETPPNVVYREPGYYDSITNLQESSRTEDWLVSLRIDHDFGFAKLASITAYQRATEQAFYDGDDTPQNWANYTLNVATHTTTQEFQLLSEKDSPFDWVFGLYYLNTFGGYVPTSIYGDELGSPPGTTLNILGTQVIDDYAAYGQTTFHVLDGTDITLGARYTIDDLTGQSETTFDLPKLPPIVTVPLYDEHASFDKLTYKVAVDHHITDNIMAYALVSRGFKSGTYNTLPLSVSPVLPEIVDDFEAGLKTQFLDRVQLNVDYFHYNIRNQQIAEVANGVVALANAPEAQSNGVDLEGMALLTDTLRLRFGGEWLSSYFVSFPNAPFYSQETSQPYGGVVKAGDASGYPTVRSPHLTPYLGVSYELPTTLGDFDFESNYSYNTGFNWSVDGNLKQGPYALLNASLTFAPAAYTQWSISLWGKNITGTKYLSGAYEQTGEPNAYIGMAAAPATYGFLVNYHL